MQARSSEFGSAGAPLRQEWAGSAEAAQVVVSLSSPAEMRVHLAAWKALAARALEANVFAEPEILLAAATHLRDGRDLRLLSVWNGSVLRGVFPLRISRLTGQVVPWTTALVPGGAPLIDRDHAADVLQIARDWVAHRFSRCRTMAFVSIPAETAVHRLFAAVDSHCRTHTSDAALCLRAGTAPPPMPRLQNVAAGGTVRIDRARDPGAIRDAVEEFLALEAGSDGQGRAGALINGSGQANFLRTATRDLARGRACRVDVLRVDGRAIGAVVVLFSGRQAWIWQAAGNIPEARAYLAAATTRSLLERATLVTARTSSPSACAMMAGLWTEAAVDSDVALTVRPRVHVSAAAKRLGLVARRASGQVARSAGRRLAAMRESYAS